MMFRSYPTFLFPTLHMLVSLAFEFFFFPEKDQSEREREISLIELPWHRESTILS